MAAEIGLHIGSRYKIREFPFVHYIQSMSKRQLQFSLTKRYVYTGTCSREKKIRP